MDNNPEKFATKKDKIIPILIKWKTSEKKKK